MNIKDKISDYGKNKDDIEKWLSVKGEDKYAVFLRMLEVKGIETTWNNVSGLYRYDKRLLFNNFRYLSFFEEYLRAILMNEKKTDYKKLHDNSVLRDCMNEIAKLNLDVLGKYFDDVDTIQRMYDLNTLRNTIAHNKIILHQENCKQCMEVFHTVLPADYRENYKKEINNSAEDLDVDRSLVIRI